MRRRVVGEPTALKFPHDAIHTDQPVQVGEMVHLGRRGAEQLQFRQVNPKEAFTLVGPDGRFYRASLKISNIHGAEALVYEEMERSPESPLRIQLVCAFLARQRMIFVSQKATELGVERILPVFTEQSLGADSLEHEKAHAWPGQAIRAARQCRRATVPEVRDATPLREAMESDAWQSSQEVFYLDDQGEDSAVLQRGPERVCLVAGPEGGWTDPERRMLRRAGAKPLVLGGRVLRAETAVVVGLAVLQHALGDLLPQAETPEGKSLPQGAEEPEDVQAEG